LRYQAKLHGLDTLVEARLYLTVSVRFSVATPPKASVTCTVSGKLLRLSGMPVIAPVRIASGESSGIFENLSYCDGMNAARKLLILKALSRTQGNRSAAAKLLGLESKYLLKLMKSLEIE
jgi:transcriptional regulator with PAS, ATPase and Fis domain